MSRVPRHREPARAFRHAVRLTRHYVKAALQIGVIGLVESEQMNKLQRVVRIVFAFGNLVERFEVETNPYCRTQSRNFVTLGRDTI